MMYRNLICGGLLVLLLLASPAGAVTIAVFPLEDLSMGRNGVNNELTDYLSSDLNRRGIDVLARETVVSFMARNRVRWLGFLDTQTILLAKEELGADLVLFGSMSLREEKFSPSLGLSLYLVRTSDAKNVWTGNGGLNQKDIVNVLGIGEHEDGEGLFPLLVQDVMARWPEELTFSAAQQHALDIEDIELGPTNVRRGEKIVCWVKLRSTWSAEDKPRVFFKSGGRVHMAESSEEDETLFSSDWLVSSKDGRYPVTMVINWPSGDKKVVYMGSFNVDNAPPQIVLDLQGVKLQGTVAFRDQVIIIPRMLRREPLARWKLTVDDEKGEEQMSFNGFGQLPLRFVWDGKGKNGWPVNEGVYRVSLQTWDRSNNMATTSQPVAVARTPPAMVLEAKNRGREMIVDLNHEGNVPIAFWQIEMRSSDGEVIKVAEGEQLPVRLNVPLSDGQIKVADGLDSSVVRPSNVIKVAERLVPPIANKGLIKVAESGNMQVDMNLPEDRDTRRVECTVVIRDILGNLSRKKILDMQSFVAEQKEEELKIEPKPVWLEEF